jgi:hypothetical protein
MQKIVYGTDTGSVEDYGQVVGIIVHDDAAMDALLEGAHPDEVDGIEMQPLVMWEDVVDAFLVTMHAEGIDHDTRARIVTTVADAIDNND